jgi:tetratricopeptide (TPR) repeat protein
VQEEIRYLSVALGESSHRPALPAEVVARRWGDCKDKTLLLVTLLRALGLEADPVLVASQSPQLPPRLLPHPDAFDHVVAQLRVHGLAYTLDATRLGQRGRLERLGVLEGASALVLRPGAAAALTTLQSHDPLALATRALHERFSVHTLGGTGTLLMRQTWHGTDAELMRLALARMGAEQRRRHVLSGYERRYPGVRLQGEPRVFDDTEANALTLEAEMEIPQLTHLRNGRWLLRFLAEPLAGAFRPPEAGGRRFPSSVASLPYRGDYRLSVSWPQDVSVLQPAGQQRVASDFFSAEVQRSFRANRSEVQMSIVPRVAELAPERLPALAADLQRLQQAVGGVVAVEADALLRPGFAGLGRRTLADSTDARLARQIERNTWAIDGGQLAGEDLADALCERAEARAERGQVAAGLDDARRAVREAPVHGRAHACLARLLFDGGRFADAVPAWTKALTLGEDAAAVLYQRGHARFYAGELAAAAADFGKAALLLARADAPVQTTHAQLWQAWALRRAGRPLPDDWQSPPPGDDLPWPRSALALASGTLPPDQLIAQLEHGRLQGDALQLALAEAWFQLGQHYRATGDAAKARQAFENVRSRSLPAALEHRAAGFELAAPSLAAPPASASSR